MKGEEDILDILSITRGTIGGYRDSSTTLTETYEQSLYNTLELIGDNNYSVLREKTKNLNNYLYCQSFLIYQPYKEKILKNFKSPLHRLPPPIFFLPDLSDRKTGLNEAGTILLVSEITKFYIRYFCLFNIVFLSVFKFHKSQIN